MSMTPSGRSQKRFQFSLLRLLLIAMVLGPALGWYGPVVVDRIQAWLLEDDVKPPRIILFNAATSGTAGSHRMIGPISVDVELGMQADALQRRSSRSR